jgi:hypothetical protein
MRVSAISVRSAPAEPIAGFKSARRHAGRGSTSDRSFAVLAAPDQVRVHTDGGVASAIRAAFDTFQQESVYAVSGQFQIGRYRRLQIVDASGRKQDR